MRKKIVMAIAILFCSIFTIAGSHISTSITTKLPCTDDLATQLAKDKDFQTFCLKTFLISSKIQSSNSRELIQRLVNHEATNAEINKLLSNLNFKNLQALKNYANEIIVAKQNLKSKYPALINLKNRKEIIGTAINLNETLKKYIESSKTSYTYPPEDCLSLLALANLCFTISDGEDQFECWLYWIGLYEACVIGSGV
jgi:hypothetical protein